VEARLDKRIAEARAELKQDIAEVRGEQKLLRWMMATVLLLLVAVFWQLFALNAKVAALDRPPARAEAVAPRPAA
jgi:hypothetical protein